MDITQFHFFDISLFSLNLFSFMLGMVWAFFNQGLFGKRIALPIFLYFAGLAAWYGLQFYIATHNINNTKKVPEDTEQSEPASQKRDDGEKVVRWTVSDTLPPEWGISQEHIDKLLAKKD